MGDHTVRVTWEFVTKRQHAHVQCRACGWSVIFPPKGFASLFQPAVDLRAAEKRLRCRRCGAKAASVKGVYREYHS